MSIALALNSQATLDGLFLGHHLKGHILHVQMLRHSQVHFAHKNRGLEGKAVNAVLLPFVGHGESRHKAFDAKYKAPYSPGRAVSELRKMIPLRISFDNLTPMTRASPDTVAALSAIRLSVSSRVVMR